MHISFKFIQRGACLKACHRPGAGRIDIYNKIALTAYVQFIPVKSYSLAIADACIFYGFLFLKT